MNLTISLTENSGCNVYSSNKKQWLVQTKKAQTNINRELRRLIIALKDIFLRLVVISQVLLVVNNNKWKWTPSTTSKLMI